MFLVPGGLYLYHFPADGSDPNDAYMNANKGAQEKLLTEANAGTTSNIVLSEATQSADLQEKLLQTEYDYEGEALGDAHLDPGRGTGHLLKDMPIPPVTPFWRTMAWVQLITGVVLMNVTIVAIFI